MKKLQYISNKKLVMLSPDEINLNPNQPRKYFDEYELSRLSQSIKQSGILQPLTVRRTNDGGYELIAGERRLKAAKMAGLKKLPCIIHRADSLTAAYYSIVENLQRCDLTVFEEAEAIARLIREYGIPHSEVAAQLGIAPSTLSNKLRILRLSESLRTRITAAGLTERHARALIRLPENIQSDALDFIIAEGLTLAETEAYIDSLLNPDEKKDSEKPKNKPKAMIGDLRIFTNSLSRLVETMVSAGLNAKQERRENDEFIEYKIKIRKVPASEKDSPQLKIC